MTLRAPKGTDDILPPESRRWRRALRVWEDLVERYGYELILTPVFEATEVFARGVGEGTEVVEKQMYTFTDKAGRSLTLRPELTASVVRAYLEAGRQGVLKVAYAGPMFRYEQPQKGRRRQFFQLDLEYLGEPSPDADVEVIEVGYRYLRELGLDDVEVRLNSIGGPGSRAAYEDVLRAYLEERRDQLTEDSRRRIAANPLRVLDSKVDGPKLTDAPAPVDHLTLDDGAFFEAVKAGLDRAGVSYVLDPTLVRGLDYYTHSVFEFVPLSYEDQAAQSSVGGGGRYDGLAEVLGGRPTPGLGFAMGLDRILLALDETVAPTLDVFVVSAGEERRAAALDLVRALRAEGVRADLDLGDRSVKAQFKAANRRDAATAAVVGEEWDAGKVTVKDLATGSEEIVAIEEVGRWATNR